MTHISPSPLRAEGWPAAHPEAPAAASSRPRIGRRAAQRRQGLFYRYGFVALDRETPRAEAAARLTELGWKRRRIGPIALWTHPETVTRIVPTGAGRFVFLGDVVPEGDLTAPFAPERLGAALAAGDGALHELLDTFAGRFALLVIEGGRARVFHDPMGTRSVFYHAEGPFAVASHALLLAECTGAGPDAAVAELLATRGFGSRKTKSLPGDRTLAENIYALIPNNCYDSARSGTYRYWPRAPRAKATEAEFTRRLETTLKAVGTYAAAHYTLITGASAGADSRLLMAGLARFGIPFKTVTWRWNDLSATDRDIIERLTSTLGAPPEILAPGRQHSELDIAYRNSGGFKKPYISTRDMRATFAGRKGTLFIRGYGGEVIRGFFNLWPTRMRALTPAEMARLYFSPEGNPPPPAVAEMFEGYIRRANYDGVARRGFDPNDIYYWEHRMGTWGASVCSEFDVATRSIPAFNSRPLFETAFGLPWKRRLTKELFLAATAELDPRLRDLPIDKMVAAQKTPRKGPKRKPRPGKKAPADTELLARALAKAKRGWRRLTGAAPGRR